MENGFYNTEKIKGLAEQLAKLIKPNDVILLHGDLGSGKTTFTSLLVKELSFDDKVQSPTFTVHRIYSKSHNPDVKIINHLDLYRLKTPPELASLDLEGIINEKNSITIVEWPELLFKTKLLNNAKCVFNIKFEFVNEKTRYVEINRI